MLPLSRPSPAGQGIAVRCAALGPPRRTLRLTLPTHWMPPVPHRRGTARRGGPMATIFLYEIAGTAMLTLLGGGVVANVILRSEERRVGKECRARWSPVQEQEGVGGDP